ncbi:dual specificity phosphatase 29-like [Carassius gibelio]|uniref:dual specificity phosphatase 29-like n=1 Tax=Carassius gibelio TaxID=101364 RepID=UPI002279C892|nr:dual specificity phosphatase 29-like [Carassius gibelio]
MSTLKKEVQLKADISSTVPENGSDDQGGLNISPATTEKTSPKDTKVKKSKKICAFFRRTWKAVKKCFQKNRVEPIGVSAQPDPEPLCVPGAAPEPEVDLADAQQLSLSAPSGPEPQETTETQETQVTTESMLHNHILVNIFQLERRMCKCKVLWTPATEVWPNVFIGNEETALDRAKLKEMGITHILNTAAYKEYLQGKIDTRAEYYTEMNITYYGVLVMDEQKFDVSKDLFPASEFIHKALSNSENKLLLHCSEGVSRSATFFLAYLMIHHEILLEDAIDHVIEKRWIRPNRDFLKQLTMLNSNLKSQRILQLKKEYS